VDVGVQVRKIGRCQQSKVGAIGPTSHSPSVGRYGIVVPRLELYTIDLLSGSHADP
jgi:hypothetical protein